MKYNVRDKVRIKSLDWYNENKDEGGYINCGSKAFFTKMSDWCGKILTINRVVEEFKYYCVSECIFSWTDEMIEGLVEEEDLNLKFKDGDRVFNTATRKWVNIIEFDLETGLYIVRYDDGLQGRSLESELCETDQVSVN